MTIEVVLDYPQTQLSFAPIVDDEGGEIVIDDSTGAPIIEG